MNEGLEFDPHYKPSMNSNHLPMVLCAMSELGANDEVLAEFRDQYATILHKIGESSIPDDWRDAIFGALPEPIDPWLCQDGV